MEPPYNPTGGYASYVVPAAFVLIIQQTLLMGAASLTALGFAQRPRAGEIAPAGLGSILGRGFAHLTIYIPALALFFVILPRVYGFSTLGEVADLVLFAVPFIFATSFVGQAAGSLFKHRETPILLFVATTLPQFFQVGVSWPREMIPSALDQLRRIFPSESLRARACTQARHSRSCPTPSSKRPWCWGRHSSVRCVPRATGSMRVRVRNGSTRSRATSTWRTPQSCVCKARIYPDFAAHRRRVCIAPGSE